MSSCDVGSAPCEPIQTSAVRPDVSAAALAPSAMSSLSDATMIFFWPLRAVSVSANAVRPPSVVALPSTSRNWSSGIGPQTFSKPARVPSARSLMTAPAAGAVSSTNVSYSHVSPLFIALPMASPSSSPAQRVEGAHERHLARRLVDVDRQRRDVRPGRADRRGGLLVELEVDDALHALRLHVARAVERLLAIERESQNTSSAPAFSASALIESDTIFTNGSESPSEM